MIYLMNSAVMPAGNYGRYSYLPASVHSLCEVVTGQMGEWQSSIGYPQNIQLIEKWTGVTIPLSRTENRFENGDQALVMRLKRRVVNPATKGLPVSEDPKDWEFAWVTFLGEIA